MFKSKLAALAGICALALSATFNPAASQSKTITFGSTNAASSNFALAVAMNKAIKKELPDAVLRHGCETPDCGYSGCQG
jgi:ABC-type proline/glycine betaine transport system substrate-binding protein